LKQPEVKSSQALQVVSSQANLYWLFQVEPSSAVWFKSSEALHVVSSRDSFGMLLQVKPISLKKPAELGLT
jgi:hypothetical protein